MLGIIFQWNLPFTLGVISGGIWIYKNRDTKKSAHWVWIGIAFLLIVMVIYIAIHDSSKIFSQ